MHRGRGAQATSYSKGFQDGVAVCQGIAELAERQAQLIDRLRAELRLLQRQEGLVPEPYGSQDRRGWSPVLGQWLN